MNPLYLLLGRLRVEREEWGVGGIYADLINICDRFCFKTHMYICTNSKFSDIHGNSRCPLFLYPCRLRGERLLMWYPEARRDEGEGLKGRHKGPSLLDRPPPLYLLSDQVQGEGLGG